MVVNELRTRLSKTVDPELDQSEPLLPPTSTTHIYEPPTPVYQPRYAKGYEVFLVLTGLFGLLSGIQTVRLLVICVSFPTRFTCRLDPLSYLESRSCRIHQRS